MRSITCTIAFSLTLNWLLAACGGGTGGGSAGDSAGESDSEEPLVEPLYLTPHTHMERGFTDDRNPLALVGHVDGIRWAVDLAEEYGGVLTFEIERPFATGLLESDEYGSFLSDELIARGHGVGTHCDRGYRDGHATVGELTDAIRENKDLVDALVGPENNKSCSGIATELDWVTAARDAGFSFVNGIVGGHYLPMPIESRPSDLWTDAFIHDRGFHYAAPLADGATDDLGIDNLLARAYPLRLADVDDFVSDEEGDIVVMPGSLGAVARLAEVQEVQNPAACSSTCELDENDVDVLIGLIEDVANTRDPTRVSKLDMGIAMSLWEPENEPALRYLFERLQELVVAGTIVWATERDAYEGYVSRQP